MESTNITLRNTVDASVIPGEDGDQVYSSVVKSVGTISVTKNIGEDYTLPTIVTSSLVNRTIKDLSVTWDKVADTKVAGHFTFTGTLTMVDGKSGYYVTNTLNIIDNNKNEMLQCLWNW